VTSEPRTLHELRRHHRERPPWLLSLVLPHVGGGRMDLAHLAAIGEHPEATALSVSGLDQSTFERLVTDYGAQFSAIELWKCPRIADLSPLEDVPGLRLVSFYWNQRATRLWDLRRTPALTGLNLDDFTRLHDLDDLARGTSLRELGFGDMIWSTSVYTSLEPVGSLAGLRSLAFSAKRIEDGRVDPLGSLTGLEELGFPTSLFSTRQVAWLRARLPETVHSRSLAAVVHLDRPYEYRGKTRDVLLVGKRKPMLSSVVDAARIERHVAAFEAMVREFRDDPALLPEPV
jgi:hypothetical protein